MSDPEIARRPPLTDGETRSWLLTTAAPTRTEAIMLIELARRVARGPYPDNYRLDAPHRRVYASDPTLIRSPIGELAIAGTRPPWETHPTSTG
ncbi:hypothetical protein [Tessaracoccus aquimaris]|uniref:hypothetical protein n=1 Tax=Tessaracoccus aquimaris TaxID=1332264 RepID=UPI001874ABE9|nr:hypothetical protein [Tessaracoccus aquimaris]